MRKCDGRGEGMGQSTHMYVAQPVHANSHGNVCFAQWNEGEGKNQLGYFTGSKGWRCVFGQCFRTGQTLMQLQLFQLLSNFVSKVPLRFSPSYSHNVSYKV